MTATELEREEAPAIVGPAGGFRCSCPLLGELHEVGVIVGPCTGDPVGLTCGWCVEHDCDAWRASVFRYVKPMRSELRKGYRRVVIEGDVHPGSAAREAEGDTLVLGRAR